MLDLVDVPLVLVLSLPYELVVELPLANVSAKAFPAGSFRHSMTDLSYGRECHQSSALGFREETYLEVMGSGYNDK